MSPTSLWTIRAFELLFIYTIKEICNIMAINLIYTWLIAIPLFAFVVFLEIKGINHKICDWVLKFFKVVLPLKDALAIYTNSCWEQSNPAYSQEGFKRLFRDSSDLVPQELFSLLDLVEQKKLTLYGHKSFSTNKIPLQPIPIEYLSNDKANWSDDYSTLYFNSNEVAYTDIAVKQKEFKKALKLL